MNGMPEERRESEYADTMEALRRAESALPDFSTSYDGEIRIVEEDGKLIWECPNCGNRDENRMNVCRRVCGYLGTNFFNQGRTAEIADRVLHVD